MTKKHMKACLKPLIIRENLNKNDNEILSGTCQNRHYKEKIKIT